MSELSPSPEAELHINSATSESPPSPPESDQQQQQQLHTKPDLVSDIVLWRRKQLNFAILIGSTATWIAMEVYQYHFITLLSWLAMAIVLCLFFWGSLHRILKKEAPDLSELEIKEETAMEHAKLLRQGAEAGIRMMLEVSGEREWFVFGGVVASLYLIALLATHLHFLTICYLGVLGGMSIPVIYVKKEQKIREIAENWRMRSERLYVMIGEKLQKIKSKMMGKQKEIKEKKME